MDSLPEELLDHVLTFVTIDHHDRTIPDIESLRSVSMVSKRLRRMAAPHLFRVCTIDQAYVDGRRHLIQAQSALLRYTAELHLNDDVDTGTLVTELTGAMPNLKVLDIIVANRRVRRESLFSSDIRSYVDLRRDDIHFKLPQISSLRVVYLRGFWAGFSRIQSSDKITENASVTTLHLQLMGSYHGTWDYCKNIVGLQKCFPNLTTVQFCGTKTKFLTGEVFRGLFSMWRQYPVSRLRALEYWHNEAHILDFWPPVLPPPARVSQPHQDSMSEKSLHYLLPFELKGLTIDTSCLLPYIGEDGAVHLNFSDLPTTLESLYIRHVVFPTTAPPFRELETRDLDDANTMPCLNHVLFELSHLESFANLTVVKLLVFIPRRHLALAARLIRAYTHQISAAAEIVLAYVLMGRMLKYIWADELQQLG
jgi:hypothetical protein